METIKSNILNQISGEHKSVYGFAAEIVRGIAVDDSVECKTAHLIFNAITRFADAREATNRTLSQLISTAQSEQARLQAGSALDLGWINSNRFEEAVQESKKLQHEVHTLAYLIGLDAAQINELFKKITSLNFSK